MHTTTRTTPRFAAITLAAVMTLATLVGVDLLADHSNTTAVHMAQAAAQQAGV